MHTHTFYERRRRIDTPRLWLRPMCRDDAEVVVAWRNEPSTAKMFFSPPPDIDDHRAWFDGDRVDRVDYMIVRRDEQRPIGVVNFKDIDQTESCAEAGKLLGDRDSRGQGMAKEAFAAWLLYGFGSLGLRRVRIRTRSDNTANIHLNRKLGFKLQDRYRHRAADGTFQQFVLMMLQRDKIEDHDYFHRIDRQEYFER